MAADAAEAVEVRGPMLPAGGGFSPTLSARTTSTSGPRPPCQSRPPLERAWRARYAAAVLLPQAVVADQRPDGRSGGSRMTDGTEPLPLSAVMEQVEAHRRRRARLTVLAISVVASTAVGIACVAVAAVRGSGGQIPCSPARRSEDVSVGSSSGADRLARLCKRWWRVGRAVAEHDMDERRSRRCGGLRVQWTCTSSPTTSAS